MTSLVRLCQRPRPLWSPNPSCDPYSPSPCSSVDFCDPCHPPNCLKICCSKPDCNPCYDFSSCDLSYLCKPCAPKCTYNFRCNECCLHTPNIDPWCTYISPCWPDDCFPPPSCCVPTPCSMCHSCTNVCTPILCKEVDDFPKSRAWEPCCFTASQPSIPCYKIPPRNKFTPRRKGSPTKASGKSQF